MRISNSLRFARESPTSNELASGLPSFVSGRETFPGSKVARLESVESKSYPTRPCRSCFAASCSVKNSRLKTRSEASVVKRCRSRDRISGQPTGELAPDVIQSTPAQAPVTIASLSTARCRRCLTPREPPASHGPPPPISGLAAGPLSRAPRRPVKAKCRPRPCPRPCPSDPWAAAGPWAHHLGGHVGVARFHSCL